MVARQGEVLSTTLFIVGVTASGKSALAMDIARRHGGEIVCADSQTLRRSLTIGTAKPSIAERAVIPHHMLDVIGPYDTYSVAQFKRDADAIIDDIVARGKLPVIVGGSGMYIDALLYDYDVSGGSAEYKLALSKLSVEKLQDIIGAKGYTMPANSQNPRHLAGVIARGGKSPTHHEPRPGAVIIGLAREEQYLKKRIADRITHMFQLGLVSETVQLLETYGLPPRRMDANAYPIVLRYLQGECTLNEAKDLCAQADWQYARKQKMWFKRNPHIHWFHDSTEASAWVAENISTA